MNVIYELRQRAGLTQALLGRLSGVPQATISRYETGVSSPRLETLKTLADAVGFEVTVSLHPKAEQGSGSAYELYAKYECPC